MTNASRGFNGSKQNQVILHVATDSEPFGCRTLVVSEARCLVYGCCCKLQLLFDILV